MCSDGVIRKYNFRKIHQQTQVVQKYEINQNGGKKKKDKKEIVGNDQVEEIEKKNDTTIKIHMHLVIENTRENENVFGSFFITSFGLLNLWLRLRVSVCFL